MGVRRWDIGAWFNKKNRYFAVISVFLVNTFAVVPYSHKTFIFAAENDMWKDLGSLQPRKKC